MPILIMVLYRLSYMFYYGIFIFDGNNDSHGTSLSTYVSILNTTIVVAMITKLYFYCTSPCKARVIFFNLQKTQPRCRRNSKVFYFFFQERIMTHTCKFLLQHIFKCFLILENPSPDYD